MATTKIKWPPEKAFRFEAREDLELVIGYDKDDISMDKYEAMFGGAER